MNRYTFNILPENTPEPPVYFHSACGWFRQGTMRYPQGRQTFYQILLVVSGTGTLRCNGKTYPLQRGCAFFTGHAYPSEYIDTGSLVTAFLTVRGDAMPGLLAHYGCGSFLFAPKVDLEKYLEGIRRIIREYYEHKRQGILSSMAYRFYVDFLEDQLRAPLTLVERTCLFIERSFAEKLTLEQLAEAGGVSVSKLCHDFKRDMGCSVFTYLLNLRLTYARQFLRSFPKARVRDAANSCGFEDISYFCKAYKKKFGCSPSGDRSGT